MQHILIVGNSSAARECYQTYKDCLSTSNAFRANTKFKGFLSFKKFHGDLQGLQNMLLGDFDDYKIGPDDRFVIGIGDPGLRCDVFAQAKAMGAQFINLVSPWAYFPEGIQIGEGNIIGSGCYLSTGAQIGDANYFNGDIAIGHDAQIGSFNFIAASTIFLGGAQVGDKNLIAVRSTFLEHSKIGNDNHICPGAIVYRGCKDNCRMAGNPALIIDKGSKAAHK